jgi:hypothetical protein
MNSRFVSITRCLTITFVCSIIVSGCAAFSGLTLPQYTYDQLKPPQEKPSVDYDVNTTKYSSGSLLYVDVEGVSTEEMNKVFEQSNFFSKYHAGSGTGEYHFSFDLESNPYTPEGASRFFNAVDTLACLFSAGIIPMYGKQNLTLTVHVTKGDQVIKQYVYKDYINLWCEDLLIVMMPFHSPTRALRETTDEMLLVFLHDLETDKLLEMKQPIHKQSPSTKSGKKKGKKGK